MSLDDGDFAGRFGPAALYKSSESRPTTTRDMSSLSTGTVCSQKELIDYVRMNILKLKKRAYDRNFSFLNTKFNR